MSNDARIIGVIGASMQGKGIYVKSLLTGDFKNHNPIIVWSPYEHRDNYAGLIGAERVDTFVQFGNALRRGVRRIVFVPANEEAKALRQFEQFCLVVWHVKDAVLVVEELSLVTQPGWAPMAWKKISTGGRGELHAIIGISQRPQGMDKDFLGNCTEIRCYRVNSQGAVKSMADSMFEDKATIAGLQQYCFIHRMVNSGENVTGRVETPWLNKNNSEQKTGISQ